MIGNSLTSISCIVGSTGRSCANVLEDLASESASSTALFASLGVIPKSNYIFNIPKSWVAVEVIFSIPLSLLSSFSNGFIILSAIISGELPG